MKRIMIDIETLGTDRNAMILSVGAVVFCEDGILDEYYRNVVPQEKRKIDYDTVRWWITKTSQKARDALFHDWVSLDIVISGIRDLFREYEIAEVWANSPSFDLEILFSEFHHHKPWKYYQERDFRTLRNLFDVEMPTTAHNALDDARAQALVVIDCLRRIREMNDA